MLKEQNLEIYDYDNAIKSTLNRIKNDRNIVNENKKHIIKFYEFCSAEGLSKARLEYYLNRFLAISRIAEKDFSKMNKADVICLVNKINHLKLSDRSKADYRGGLKKFFKWLKNVNDRGVYPAEVNWIKANNKSKNHLLPEELLTEEDIKKMVNATEHIRDKALIFTLYESGCRIGEVLSLKIKHVTFDKYGGVLIVNGKTGMRRIRVIGASPYLSAWINIHPDKDNPEMPLWIVIGTTKEIAKQKHKGYKFNWSYNLKHSAVLRILRRTAKKAGIKKRVNPHSFRHSRATFLANILTEAQMKEYFGWVQSSDMASVYVHMSGRDVDNVLLNKVYGIKQEEDKKEESKLKPKKCLRCGKENGATATICETCGAYLDIKTAIEAESKEKNLNHILKTITENQVQMAKVLKELSGKKFDIVLPSLEERQKIIDNINE